MDLGTEKVSVLFRKLFFPTLAGMLSMCAVTAIDGVFVGHGIGAQGIAAVNICISILMLFTGLGLMTGIGGSVIASVALSKGKIKYAQFNVTQSILFVTAVMVFFVALIMFFPERTAYILGASDHLMPMVKTYLLWFAPSLIFQMWVSVALFIIRLDGAPKLAMWCSVIAAGINTFLGWLFIFPFGWGIMGAAFAATAGLFVGGTIAVVYLLFYAKTLRFYPVKIGLRGFYLFWDNIVSQCRIGSSALLGEATMAVLMFAGNHVFMLYLGDDG
ncbi:MAG: polysaccharide biosynthesis C-terminal domain-containing protein, partial [Alphaproteobacteria bacterium]|nr:polysaccharide biosynthesis C-terminal domain-containing protein [Alphaproteobacteria bacterium]